MDMYYYGFVYEFLNIYNFIIVINTSYFMFVFFSQVPKKLSGLVLVCYVILHGFEMRPVGHGVLPALQRLP